VINLPDYFPFLLGALYVLLELAAIIAAVEALLGNRSSQSVIAWTLLLIIFPLIGLPLYLMFGGRTFSGYVNARRSGNEPLQRLARELSTSLPVSALAEFTPGEADHRVLSRLASMPFFAGNSSRLLIDGDATSGQYSTPSMPPPITCCCSSTSSRTIRSVENCSTS
jgi:cardiolipin synthase